MDLWFPNLSSNLSGWPSAAGARCVTVVDETRWPIGWRIGSNRVFQIGRRIRTPPRVAGWRVPSVFCFHVAGNARLVWIQRLQRMDCFSAVVWYYHWIWIHIEIFSSLAMRNSRHWASGRARWGTNATGTVTGIGTESNPMATIHILRFRWVCKFISHPTESIHQTTSSTSNRASGVLLWTRAIAPLL